MERFPDTKVPMSGGGGGGNPVGIFGGGGHTLGNSWWGCAGTAQFSKF